MDAGIAIKPVSGVAVSDYARPALVPLQEAVKTELAAPTSIAAAAHSDQTRPDTQPPRSLSQQSSPSAAPDNLSRGYVIDAQTREVIFRVVDTRTRQVVRQIPDQALLRMRAYAQALARGQSAMADLQTNLSA